LADEFFNGQYSDSASVLTLSSPWKGLTAEFPGGHGRSMMEGCDGLDFGRYDIGIRILCGCEYPLLMQSLQKLTFRVAGNLYESYRS
jgi:hypothetical protein